MTGGFTIEFKGTTSTNGWTGMDVPDMSTDSTNLTGALDTASHPGNGKLPNDATFDASITDAPAVVSTITTDGKATVTATTITDGGSGLGVNTTTQGSR